MRFDVFLLGCMLIQQIATDQDPVIGRYSRLTVEGDATPNQNHNMSSHQAKYTKKQNTKDKIENVDNIGNKEQYSMDNMLRRNNFTRKNGMGFGKRRDLRLKQKLEQGLEPPTKQKRGRKNPMQGGRLLDDFRQRVGGILSSASHKLVSIGNHTRYRVGQKVHALKGTAKGVVKTVLGKEAYDKASHKLGQIRSDAKYQMHNLKNVTKSVIKSAGGFAKTMVLTPLVGIEKLINAKDYIFSLGKNLSKKVVDGVTKILGEGWEALEAVQLPGWNVVMYFPRGVITVVNKAADTAVFITKTTGRAILATHAYAIFAATNTVSKFLGPVFRTLGLNCIRMPAHKYAVDNTFVDGMETSEGHICGITHIQALDNIQITRDDDSFLVTVVPLEIKNLTISFKAVNITGLTGTLIDDSPMNVTIDQVNVSGTKKYTAGTLLKFVSIHLHVDHIIGFEIRFPNQEEKGSELMEMVESIGDILTPIIVDTMNKKWNEFEKLVADALKQMIKESLLRR